MEVNGLDEVLGYMYTKAGPHRWFADLLLGRQNLGTPALSGVAQVEARRSGTPSGLRGLLSTFSGFSDPETTRRTHAMAI